jgi:hypothetical protein
MPSEPNLKAVQIHHKRNFPNSHSELTAHHTHISM